MLMDLSQLPAQQNGKTAALVPLSFSDALYVSENLEVEKDFELMKL